MSTTTTTTTSTASDQQQVTNAVTLPSTAPASGPQAGWDGSLIAIDAFTDSDTSTAVGYGQTLDLLPFAQGQALAVGATDALTLDRTESTTTNGKTTTNPVTLYDLIFAQANNLFPVQSNGVMQGLFTGTYAPLTVPTPLPSGSASTDADAPAPSVNAWLFYQQITADPTSTLAQDFVNTCNSAATNATGSASLQSALNGFFQGTEGFKNVTGTDYILVQSYLNRFAYAWAEFESVYLYYLTSAGGTAPGSAAGAVVLAAKAGNTLPIDAKGNTDANAGYTLSYYSTQDSGKSAYDSLCAGNQPSVTADKTLSFASQQLVSDPNADIPAICLQCSYASLSTFTGEDSDWGSIVPVLGGTVDGQQVLGVDWRKQPPTETWEDKAKDGIDDFWNSWWTQAFLGATNLIMGISMLAEGVGWLTKKFKKAEATAEQETGSGELSEQQVDDIKAQGKDAEATLEQETQTTADKLGQDVQVPKPEDLSAQQQQVAEQQQANDEQVETKAETAEQQTEEQELQNEADQIQDDAQIQVDQPLEADADAVKQEADEVEQVKPGETGAQQTLAEDQQHIAGTQEQITNEDQADSDTTAEQLEEENQNVEDEAQQVDKEEEQEKQEQEKKQEDEKKDGDNDVDGLDDLR